MDKEANKENAPAETPIPLEEGWKGQLRWSNKHRRPLEALNLSDFYPIDASVCPNSLETETETRVGTRISNLCMNGDDGDVFLGGTRGGCACRISWGRIHRSKDLK
ncbi:hypothetical protein I7I48_03214 [Histoplasma ohiense]|nr:hypothetical protein I7I48_03214 [Histoplasma ohiense (nom. inval.)]